MKNLSKKVPKYVKRAASSSVTGHLVRFGYAVRGILYFLTGFYGLAAAIGLQGSTKDTLEIVKIMGSVPLGRAVLIAVFAGLVGYGLWGLIRAIIDPLEKGTKISGLFSRIGYLTSGLSYLALSTLPMHLLLNMATVDSSNSKWSAFLLLKLPGGLLAVTIIGLVIIIGGIGQIIYGFRKSFVNTLQTMKAGKQEKILLITGKYGYIGRGIIYSLIGIFFLKAGISGDSVQAKDPGEILLWIWQLGGGSILLGLVSLGLIALGVYSVVASTIIKLNDNE